jgi:hypothetical protein
MTNQINTTVLNNLEWIFSEEYTNDVLSGVSVNKIFNLIKKIDTLPLVKGDIKFSDDRWNFRHLVLDRFQNHKCNFIFTEIDPIYKEQIKFLILTSIWSGRYKIQTLTSHLCLYRQFTKFLIYKNIYSFEYVSLNTVKIFLNSRKVKQFTISGFKTLLINLFQFYSTNYKKINWHDIYSYLTYNSKDELLTIKAEKLAGKTPNIPKEYFDNLLPSLVQIMNNESLPIDDRGIAAALVFISQIGFRISEFVDCTINSVRPETIKEDNKTVYYLDYYVTKNAKGNLSKHEAYTILTDLSYKAYYLLTDIYKDYRTSLNSNLLFTPICIEHFPIDSQNFYKMYVLFLLNYYYFFDCINVSDKYPELKSVDICTCLRTYKIVSKARYWFQGSNKLTYPLIHQYRVHICTEFYRNNVPFMYIQKHMNHLTAEATSYYVRPEKDLEKEKEYSEAVMKMIVTGEAALLGEKSDDLMLRINHFIKTSKLNVSTDLNTIASNLSRKFPVRAKLGGICIKSGPIRDCKKNDITDELFCSYGMCPNNFHVYYMVDITYKDYTTLINSIQYNQTNGFIRASEKETNKLKWIVQKKLLPELDELKNEIAKQGADNIIKKHSQLKPIIDNIITIYEDVIKWIK